VFLLCAFLTVYLVVLFARVVLSWFPIRGDSPLAPINSILFDITEPVLAPFRRIIPPIGMLDVSVLVVSIILIVLRGIVCSYS
jgi:YggT family protein